MVESVTPNAASKLKDNQAQYSALLYPEGTFVDDILVHRFGPHHFFLCVNAANQVKDYEWIAAHNRFDAEVFIDLAVEETGPCWVAFYGTDGFESAGGRRLASLAVARLRETTTLDVEEPKAMRLPILRETRMPAVVCSLGPPNRVVPGSSAVTRALATTLDRWIAAPVER